MEIKRQLNAAAKRLTPQIEASNTGAELRRLASRFDELLTYAEAKEVRRKESEATGMSFAQRTEARIAGDIQKGKELQAAEELELLSDQQQHLAQPDVAEENIEITTPAKEKKSAGRKPAKTK